MFRRLVLTALLVAAAGTVWFVTRRRLHRKLEKVERQRAVENERARIAKDIHDDLGSTLTQITMWSDPARGAGEEAAATAKSLSQIHTTARELTRSMDEIVWAMNPRHDSLASLVSYFSLYADRFLGLANITWRLEGPGGAADQAVDSRRRHQLFLAFKEALTNVVRHSGATEVCVKIHSDETNLRMSIADNGRGLPADVRAENMDGVANMRMRIEKLGGHFDITSIAGRGTTVQFNVPAHFKS